MKPYASSYFLTPNSLKITQINFYKRNKPIATSSNFRLSKEHKSNLVTPNHFNSHQRAFSYDDYSNQPSTSITQTNYYKPDGKNKEKISFINSIRTEIRLKQKAKAQHINQSHNSFLKEKLSFNHRSESHESSTRVIFHSVNDNNDDTSHIFHKTYDNNDNYKESIANYKTNKVSHLITDNYQTKNIKLNAFIMMSRNINKIKRRINYKKEDFIRKREHILNKYQENNSYFLRLNDNKYLLEKDIMSTLNAYVRLLKNEVSDNIDILQAIKEDKEKLTIEKNYILHSFYKLKSLLEKEIKCRNLMIQVKHSTLKLPRFLGIKNVTHKYYIKKERGLIKNKVIKSLASKRSFSRSNSRKETRRCDYSSTRMIMVGNKNNQLFSSPIKKEGIIKESFYSPNHPVKTVHFHEASSDIDNSNPFLQYLDFDTVIFNRPEDFIQKMKLLETNYLDKAKKYLKIKNDIFILKRELRILNNQEEEQFNKEELEKLIYYPTKAEELQKHNQDLENKIENINDKNKINDSVSQIINPEYPSKEDPLIKPSLSINYLNNNLEDRINIKTYQRLLSQASSEYQLIYLYLIEIINTFTIYSPQMLQIDKESQSRQIIFDSMIDVNNFKKLPNNYLRHCIIELLNYTERGLNGLFGQYKKEKEKNPVKVNSINQRLTRQKKMIKAKNLQLIYERKRRDMIDELNKKKNKIYIKAYRKAITPYYIKLSNQEGDNNKAKQNEITAEDIFNYST